ncbi:MAG: methyltransferase domain-containing protein [Nitrospirae bacterium]|nr:methyltransferase domain-containing protein [Nitrospirota bacterium]
MNLQKEAKELRKLWGGFWSARVLLTANNFDAFDYLKSPKTAGEIAKILETDNRATEIVLDALTGLGLLKKSGTKYKNSSTANRFLVKGMPYYQGDIIRHADTLWKNWSGLDEIMKTGEPNRAAHNHETFIKGMHNIAFMKAKDVINVIDLKGVKNALDLGGGPGTYCMEMAKRGVSVTLFDRHETIKIAKEVIGKSKAKGIDFIEGDFIADDIGKGYDLIFISQVLHAFTEKNCMSIIKKSKAALNPKGRIVIQEFYIDKSRTMPPQSALFSVNMLVNTHGRCYAPEEMKQWLSKAGLKNVKHKIFNDSVMVEGVKK